MAITFAGRRSVTYLLLLTETVTFSDTDSSFTRSIKYKMQARTTAAHLAARSR